MKRNVIVVSIALISLFLSSCGGEIATKPWQPPIKSEEASDSPPKVDPETEKRTYRISYYAVERGEVVEINPLLYEPSGNYPTSYEAGETVYISPLKNGLVDISENEDREFAGWYADANCSVLYSGKTVTDKQVPDWIGDGSGWLTEETYGGFWISTQGDLVFYAKLRCGLWIGPF